MKKSTKQAVNKSLTPEEKAILGNIRSLLEQLDSEGISEDMDAPVTDDADVAMSKDGMEDDPTDDEDDVMKTCDDKDDQTVAKSSTPDEVANNNAEDRLNAEDTDTEKALAVLKAILTKGEVKKSAVQKSADYARLERKVDSLTSAVESMIEGFGLVKTPAPVNKSSQILNRLEQIVNKSANNARREGDLSDVMTSLFGVSR